MRFFSFVKVNLPLHILPRILPSDTFFERLRNFTLGYLTWFTFDLRFTFEMLYCVSKSFTYQFKILHSRSGGLENPKLKHRWVLSSLVTLSHIQTILNMHNGWNYDKMNVYLTKNWTLKVLKLLHEEKVCTTYRSRAFFIECNLAGKKKIKCQ